MAASTSYVVPNTIIGLRVVFAFVAVWLLRTGSVLAGGIGVGLIVVTIAMDGLDGYAARRLGLASPLGAVLDITADRIVEHVFWIAFAVAGVVPLWVPLIVVTRSLLVDAARGMAFARGKTPFGRSTMMRSSLTRFLTGSRLMRNAYGGVKTAAFVLLALTVVIGTHPVVAPSANLAVVMAVALCLVRGVPVLVDSRDFIAAAGQPGGNTGSTSHRR